ncbi:sensor histidine kinase [uncultured Alistipes sp.]|jgi:putative regulator of cell autolysis|uniref:sensor histidine kinase n=1 Tax=uncultured Alistipes sp. TaxID=538949 RepID=UPI0025D3F338|nr:sensor histidine kinase [uncultured Alistipes sp.]
MKALKAFGIIHFFAILHAAVALLCRLAGINDELVLTLLTIVMIVLICLNRGLSVEFTAASVIVVNVIGYLLGTGGAELIERIISSPPAVHAVSTFLTTEILGWSIVWFTKLFRRGDDQPRAASVWTPRIGLLLLAVGVIFALRLAYIEVLSSPSFSTEKLYNMVNMLASNSAALIILLCVNIIYIRYMRRHFTRQSFVAKTGMLALFVLAASALVTLIVGLHLPFKLDRSFSGLGFMQLFLVTLLVEVTLYSIVFMVDYALVARAVLRAERGKAHQAQFLYMKLKQQVNPHFLFNSLNILDCLVCEQKTEQASSYIHKLAGVYRYMLQNEEKPLVSLSEEMAFVEMYVDLLHVRFADGFRVEAPIPEEALNRSVVPCSVQLLIENAIKHNSVDPEHPLQIRIEVDDKTIKVTNNLRPKVSATPSTRVGLNYIRQQYLDLAGTPIGIRRSEDEYCVTLPLLT